MESRQLKKIRKLILFSVAIALPALVFTGCQSPDIYYWGNYENVVYGMYAHPDKVPPDAQVQKLEADRH